MSLIYNATFDSQTHVLSLLDKAGNVISSCEVPSKGDPLTLTATADNSSVKLTETGKVDNTYEVNTGSSWVPYTFGTVINLNKGQSCKWRCTSHPTTFDDYTTYVKFVMTGSIEASGEVYSMLSSNLSDVTTLKGYDYAFIHLFEDCTSLIKAPELPATTLTPDCYDHMFAGCTALTQAPQLPATTLSEYCYLSMFKGCTALTQAPQLPATNLASGCYSAMFGDCTALTQAPQLPATNLASNCYSAMFRGCTALTQAPQLLATNLASGCCNSMFGDCTALTQAPQLPATNLASNCYSSMFSGCTALTQAPQLPATTLASNCYYSMFNGCSKLDEVHISATETAENALGSWLYRVSSKGYFYCKPNATIFPRNSASGIPSGWVRLDNN